MGINWSGLTLGLVALHLAMPAGAVSWDSFTDIGLTTGSIYCSSNSNPTPVCQANSSAGLTGSVFKLTAYSTPTLNNASGSGGVTPADTGTWVDAKIRIYSGETGGIAIANNVQPSATENDAPQHAMDNRGVNDILVVDFNPDNVMGQNDWDVSSFALGYTCRMLNTTYSNDDPGCSTSSSSVNVDAWLGGTGSINFTDGSFAGFSTNGSTATLPGFTNLTFTPDPGGTGLRTVSGDSVGRYLVIAPSLSGWKDAFKVKAINADLVPPPPPPNGHTVPLPGSVPLVGLALVALFYVSRWRALPVRIRR